MTNALHILSERGMDGGFGHRGGGHFLLPLLCMVVVLGAAGLLVWMLARRRPTPAVAGAAPAAAASNSPTFQAEAILAERLARSEISPDDYRTTIAALRDQPSGA